MNNKSETITIENCDGGYGIIQLELLENNDIQLKMSCLGTYSVPASKLVHALQELIKNKIEN